MVQTKVSLDEQQLTFLKSCRVYGFKDQSSLVRAALARLQSELEQRDLALSADLYAELYEQDTELRDLTDHALSEWPE